MNTSPQQENETIQQYVTRLMEEAVALKGEDYVYEQPTSNPDDILSPTCYYVWDNQPSCIVGHVLYAAGVPLDDLHEHEGNAALMVAAALIPEWNDGKDDSSRVGPTRLVRALDKAQSAQDSGSTWGEALRAFKEELTRGESREEQAEVVLPLLRQDGLWV
jgi:hypothetical protein